MTLSKIISIAIISFFLLIPLSNADTTFFDQDNIFIMYNSTNTTSEVTEEASTGTTSSGGPNSGSSTSGCVEDFEIIVPSEISLIHGYVKQISIIIKNTGSCILYKLM